MKGVKGTLTPKRVCPHCGTRKGFYAQSCRKCAPKQAPLLGRKGKAHPAWKGGQEIDRDGYVRTYAPDHPWPRRNGYVRENMRVMELHLGRRLHPDEVVHHKDHNRQNNDLHNLEVKQAAAHSRDHRREDTHQRRRDQAGRFA